MHQVLRYAKGGEYQPHYDANERSRRVLTVQSAYSPHPRPRPHSGAGSGPSPWP